LSAIALRRPLLESAGPDADLAAQYEMQSIVPLDWNDRDMGRRQRLAPQP
jgi:hypothetical protein